MVQNTKNITWSYIIGLIETDGSFHFTITPKSGQTKPMVKIAQKTNTNVLGAIIEFLKSYDIVATVDPGESTKKVRAPALRVQGRNQVARLLVFLKKNAPLNVHGKKILFASAKLRDFNIVEEICGDSKLSIAKKIDLLKSMRKTSQNVADLELSSMKSRYQFETEFGLQPNESVNAARSILSKIDQTYKQTVDTLEQGIEQKSLKVEGNYLTGLIDGDGGYYVTYQFQEPTQKFKKRNIAWQGNLTLTMETSALLTIKVFMYAFGIETSIIPGGRDPKDKNKITFYQIKVRKQDYMRTIMRHHDKYPLIGNYRQIELDLVAELYQLRDANMLRNFDKVAEYLHKVHNVSQISPKGPPRKPLTEVLATVKEWLI